MFSTSLFRMHVPPQAMSVKRAILLAVVGCAALISSVGAFWPTQIGRFGPSSSPQTTPLLFAPLSSEFCRTPDLDIPDNSQIGVTDTMTITTEESIQGLYVSLDIDHPYVGDLKITLTHVDTGTTVTLVDRPGDPAVEYGCERADMTADIDDYGDAGEAETMCADAPAISGRVHGGDPPSSALLQAFRGESMSGTWQLTITDHAALDTGRLQVWCLTFNQCLGAISDASGLTIDRAGNDVLLQWRNPNNATYEIYRAENAPYFEPDTSSALSQTQASSFTDVNALGDSTVNYTYKVRGFDVCPPLPGDAARVSEFDFTLVSGSD